jgi:two-component system, cell cycle sensor histidine kinase and response regulator CckA
VEKMSDDQNTSKSIVLADHDPLVQETLGELLRDKGYDVHIARDGLEALLAIRKVKPGFVLLDIVMPKIDGSRVCWLIRQDRNLRNTPIIAITSLSPQDIRRFHELSADAYVAKGPLAVMANNLLSAIKYVEQGGRGDLVEGGIFGFEGFRPRQLISQMLIVKGHYESLMRLFECGVVELDEAGRILMANVGASKILGKKEQDLIGEMLPSFFPPPDRRAIQDLLDELTKARLPEEHRMGACIQEREMSLRLCSTVEDGKCNGIIATIELRPPGSDRKE